MDVIRWIHLGRDNDDDLTPEELAEGWHFCDDWDGLLIGPGMENELEFCTHEKQLNGPDPTMQSAALALIVNMPRITVVSGLCAFSVENVVWTAGNDGILIKVKKL